MHCVQQQLVSVCVQAQCSAAVQAQCSAAASNGQLGNEPLKKRVFDAAAVDANN